MMEDQVMEDQMMEDQIMEGQIMEWKVKRMEHQMTVCQNSTDKSPLTSPGRGRGTAMINASRSASVDIPGGSHATVASNLFAWQNSECSDRLPCPLLRRIHLYASEATLQQAFMDNNAVFHKKCVSC